MENETVSKNFIENIIDKDLAEVFMTPCILRVSRRNRMDIFISIIAEIYSFKLWSCTGI